VEHRQVVKGAAPSFGLGQGPQAPVIGPATHWCLLIGAKESKEAPADAPHPPASAGGRLSGKDFNFFS